MNSSVVSLTEAYLNSLSQCIDETCFNIEHGDVVNRDSIMQKIRHEVKNYAGVYIYLQETENENIVLYVGKAKNLYSRIKCHYEESIFDPQKHNGKLGIFGDSKRGLYPKFFRDTYPGKVKICWLKIEEEWLRRTIESALHIALQPVFIDFKKNFSKLNKGENYG